MKKYYEEVDILKGIAIILVIIGHAIIVFPINLLEIEWCNNLYTFIYISHMPLFFLISGFCYSYKNNLKEYLTKKIQRILIPYLIFSFIDLLPRILLTQFVNRPMNAIDGIKRIFLEGGEYWFLYSLFCIFLFMPLIYKYIIKSRKKYCKYILLLFIILIDLINLPEIFLIEKTIYFYKYFIIGCIIKEEFERTIKIKDILAKYKFLIIAISFAIMCFYIIFINEIENYYIVQIMISIIGCLFWYEIGNIIKLLNGFKKLVKTCGKYSLQLYLLNGYFLTFARMIIVNVCNINNAIIIILFNSLFCILLPILLIDKVFMKFKIKRILTGCNGISDRNNN